MALNRNERVNESACIEWMFSTLKQILHYFIIQFLLLCFRGNILRRYMNSLETDWLSASKFSTGSGTGMMVCVCVWYVCGCEEFYGLMDSFS